MQVNTLALSSSLDSEEQHVYLDVWKVINEISKSFPCINYKSPSAIPCKLSSQVRTCLFICDSLLSPINKSKRRNYLGRSVSLIALKHNLSGHEWKHRCSRTPQLSCISRHPERAAGGGTVPAEEYERRTLAVQAALLIPLRCTQSGFQQAGESARALQRADVSPKPAPRASSHHHTSLQSGERRWTYRGAGLGDLF